MLFLGHHLYSIYRKCLPRHAFIKTMHFLQWENHAQNCPKAVRTCALAEYGCTKEEVSPSLQCILRLMTVHVLLCTSSPSFYQMSLQEWNRHNLQQLGYHNQLLMKLLPLSTKKEGLLLNSTACMVDSVADGVKEDGTSGVPVKIQSVHDLRHKEILDQMADIDLVNMVRRLDSQKSILEEKVASKDRRIQELESKVSELEETVRKVDKKQEDFGFRLMLEESHSYLGEMIWRIPNFRQRQEDAKSNKFSSIYSLPFYSSRYGYKMCLRLYPYGDGSGKGTHLSLFLVIMRGEYDDILEWPFRHKVTFQLLNLKSGQKDVVDAFRADPESSSFKKPVSDMNVATGCPRFAPLDALYTQGFVANDTIFLRAKVESYNGSKLGPF